MKQKRILITALLCGVGLLTFPQLYNAFDSATGAAVGVLKIVHVDAGFEVLDPTDGGGGADEIIEWDGTDITLKGTTWAFSAGETLVAADGDLEIDDTVSVNGNLDITGTFSGNGSGLTSLPQEATTNRYDQVLGFAGTPGDSAEDWIITPQAFEIPAVTDYPAVYAVTAPTDDAWYAGVWVNAQLIGTVTIPQAQNSGTLVLTNTTKAVLIPGSRLRLVSQPTADSTCANIQVGIPGGF